MTVNTISSIAEFDTNGVATSYPFYFKFLANEDLVVTYVNPLGASSVLTLGMHYTANGAGDDDGGSIVTTSALAGPGKLIVSREMESLQQTSIRNQGKFLPEIHEDVFDRLTMLIQQGLTTFTRALKRPLGRDYFFAEDRQIKSIKDPTEQQDAATKHSVEAYVAEILETGQGPINNAANVVYVYPDGVARTVQSLATKNAPLLGAAGIAYRAGTQADKNREWVSILEFGGGESIADNLAAYNVAKAALAPGGRMRFPRLSTGVYLWPTAGPDLSGIIIDPDPGVTFSGAIFAGMFASNIITTTDYVYRVTAGNPKDYDLEIKAEFSRGSKRNSKQLWLGTSDVVDRRPTPVIAYGAGAQLLYKRMTLGADGITTFAPAGGGADSLLLTPPNGGITQLGVYPLRPGSAISAGVNVPPSGAGEIAVGVIWSTGYCVLRGYPGTAIWELATKYDGVAVTSQVQPAISDTAGYHPDCPIITIRFITSIRFQILISGSVITDFQLTSGYLMLAGFGITGIESGSSINLVGWYTEKFKVADSPRPRTLGFLGDSMTDDLHGAWPWWTANALDGSFGIRVNGIENRAISGQTTAQQYNNIVANPFVKASDIVVFLGTNDVQTANSYAAFLAAYTAILVLMKSQGRSITLVIFPTWYTQAQAGGGGGATQNPGKGGDMRAAIGRFAADNGYNLVDLTHVTGPVDASYLTSTFTDPYVRDNLHGTSYLNKLIGYEVAKAIAETACPVAVPDTPWTNLHPSIYASGFTGTLQFRFIRGDVELRGEVTSSGGTIADNTIILTLQEFLRPEAVRRSAIYGTSTSAAGNMNINNSTGEVRVFGVATSTSVSFDGVRYTP